MQHVERTIRVPIVLDKGEVIAHLRETCKELAGDVKPVRLVVTATTSAHFECELSGFVDCGLGPVRSVGSIFDFNRRTTENCDEFNIALVVPTGIGAEIGGHAGDAGPVARMLGELSDNLLLHPNVVNASDVNEMPDNTLYIEGSVLTRLLMGTVGLQRVRNNRLLIVVAEHDDELFVNAAINAVNGARASFGLLVTEIVRLQEPLYLNGGYSASGRAVGRIAGINGLMSVLDRRKGSFDAVAISSVIDVPKEAHQAYFDGEGTMVNPWGGVEATLTHLLSSVYSLPTAHSPMFESRDIANMDPGVVDSRMAAEAVSLTFLQCILKGLQKSPRIQAGSTVMEDGNLLTAADVSCLVIPDGCLGLPTLAALEQGIPVIAVEENRNIMKNDLSVLPWPKGKFYRVSNYWEAAGVISSLRAGIDPRAVRRPLPRAVVVNSADESTAVVEIRSPSTTKRSGATQKKIELVD